MAERVLVTSALPYANGPLHIGHFVEYVQSDVYVRFLRSCGVDAVYFCADDTHGTPIELNARKHGVPPEEFVQQFYEAHQADFRDFDMQLDCFWTTHSPENRHYAELIYQRLKDAGDIDRKEIEQAYCDTDQRFLPDRFIRGTCPFCKATDQYGDFCEKCGKTYTPGELLDAHCAVCGQPPVKKRSAHLFFKLSRHAGFLKDLIRNPDFLIPQVANQLQQFFEKGLADWDVSRDGPYFGFPIPGEDNKFFYVWLDAPIGYIAVTERWAKTTGKAKDALAYWSEDSKARIVHVIGKDIVYFHALFWPAMLKVAGLHRPDKVVVHGHLTVNGEKMSKSRGTLIAARTYLDKLDPSYLRYFFAASLGGGPEDFDLSLSDFRLRVNGELVNNIGNLANRALSLLAGSYGKKLSGATDGPGRAVVEAALAQVPAIRAAYERLDTRTAVKLIAELSQSANQFLQARAPWALAKTDQAAAHRDLTDAAEVAYLVGSLLAPVVPRLSAKLFEQLAAPPLTFQALTKASYPLLSRDRAIGTPAPLIARLEEAQVDALIVAPKAEETEKPRAPKPPAAKPAAKEGQGASSAPAAGSGAPAEKAAPAEIDYDDFAKVTLKVGKVLTAERVPKADKLLHLTVDVGEGAPRTIAAGIAQVYAPEQVVGRMVVVVSNLKPRKIRGIESRGMLLAAGAGTTLSLVDPGALPPGSEVK